MDKYLVTVGRFRQYVNYLASGGAKPQAGSGTHSWAGGAAGGLTNAIGGGGEPGWIAGWNDQLATTSNDWDTRLTSSTCNTGTPYYNPAWTWTSSPSTNEHLPINCLTWYEAYAFCIWDGGGLGALPSETEWEYAAAGGDQQRDYPWGSAAPSPPNQYAIYGCGYPSVNACVGLPNIAPVGTASMGAARWGHLDVVGDEFEWTMDNYQATYPSPCNDCVNLNGGPKVMRGSHWAGTEPFLHPWYRDQAVVAIAATTRSYATGFRCVRAP
jgi:formylglycine-generating enzyme required for sulfatase activity